jgi:multiple sugar transport system substrate-binding protein
VLGSTAAVAAPRRRKAAGVTIEYWKFDDTADRGIRPLIKQWNAMHPDKKVVLRTFPFNDYVNGPKLTTAFAAGKGPDVFWVSASTMLDFVNGGIAADLSSVLGKEKAKYDKAAIDAATVGGKLVVVPFELNPVGLYYRKDFFAKAGIKPPTNWADLRSAAKELTQGKRTGITIEPAAGAYGNFAWFPFLWSAKGEVVDKDWKKSALRTPQAAEAFELWGNLVRDGSAAKKLAATSADIGPLGRGETCMQVCGFWAVDGMAASFKNVDYGLIPIPAPKGGKPTTVYGGWMQMVNGKSDKAEAAMEFTRWMWVTQTKFPHTWSCEVNTEYSTRADVRKTCDSKFKGVHYEEAAKLIPIARAEPRYSAQMGKGISDGLQAAMFSGKSGEESANIAADEIDRFLRTYRGAH